MTSEDVRRLCVAQPFVPFLIRLINGRTFMIPHRDWVATVQKSFRALEVAAETRWIVVNTTLIVSLERQSPLNEAETRKEHA